MKIYLLLFTLIFSGVALAQESEIISDSDQSGKTIAFINVSENALLNSHLNDNDIIVEDYKTIDLLNNLIPHLDISLLENRKVEIYSEKDINLLLNKNRIAQQILSYWFNWQSDRTFDIRYVRDEGILDADEIEKILDTPNKKFSFQKSTGLKPLNETYLFLVDFRNLNLSNHSNDEETGLDNLSSNTYSVTVNYYLVKFDFNNSIAERFFNDYWISKDTEDNLKKKENFASADFPFRLVYVKSFEAAGMQQIPENEQLDELVQLAQERAVSIIRNESLYDKYNVIQNDKPITAAMGNKQKLRFDSRYSVYENQIDDGGGIKQKKKGFIKVMKVGKNSSLNDISSTSEFYQIAGEKISTSGMYLEKKPSIGLNIGFDRTVIGPINTSGRIEYYFSRLLDGTIPPGKKAKGMTSLKIYFEGGYNDGTYSIEERNRKFEFVRGSIGISKDFYPFRNLHWSPFIGYGIESATWKGSDNTISTNFVDAGVRLGINIIHNIQMIATIKDNIIVDSVLLDAEREVINNSFDYAQTFSNRKGVSLGLGLRVML